jgi:uncharacterized membrane protein
MRSMPKIILYIWLLTLLLFTVSVSSVSSQDTYTHKNSYLIIYEDGSVLIIDEYEVFNPPQDITLKLLGNPIYIEAYSGGNPIPLDIQNSYVSLTALGTDLQIKYIVTNLTSKVGEEWTFSLVSEHPVYLLFPEDAMIVDIQPSNYDVSIINNSLALFIQPGSINIKYILVPKVSVGGEPGQPVFETDLLWPILAVILLAVLLILLFKKKLKSKPKMSVTYEELDNRDKKILSILAKHGELTARELIEKTGIPKTPLYRRLRRLEASGYIDTITRSGITYYRLRTK